MAYSSFIARRYLRSQRNAGFVSFITFIGMLGVALGTATLIISLSVLGGFEREITEKVIGFSSHVQVVGFQNIPLYRHEENAERLARSIPAISSVTPFVAREALIKTGEGVDGILLKGVDPLLDATGVSRYMVEGNYDVRREPGADPKLVLGRRLAARLAVGIGQSAVIFGIGSLGDGGQPRVMRFRITGLYSSGMAEYDDIYAFTDLRDAQMLFQYGDAVSGYDLRVTTLDSAEAVALEVQDLLGYPHYARTVFDTYRNLFSWIELQKKPIPIILGLIIIVATVNIIGTLLMMVLDKTREIGILASLGATGAGISAIFLRQGMTIAVAGTFAGNALAFVLCSLQAELKVLSLPSDIYFMNSVPILLRPEYFLAVSGVTLVLCLLTSLIPARLAARLHPVSAIRFS